MESLQPGLYPENELASPPLPQPIRKPSVVSSIDGTDDDYEPFVCPSKLGGCNSRTKHRKHESYHLSGSVYLITSAGKTLNLPVPSGSPADPLNWTAWKRSGAIIAIACFWTASLTVVQAASLLHRDIFSEFKGQNVTPRNRDSLVSAPILFVGVGALLWVPLSLGMGRRPVFLFVTLMMLVVTICAGYTVSYWQILVCFCIINLGQGFCLTSAFLMTIDMTFIHQRPKAVALLVSLAVFAGNSILALVPYLSLHGDNWRQFYRVWSIPMAISFVLVVFLYPETYFKRPTVAFDGLILMQSATETLTVYKDNDVESNLYRDLPELPIEQRAGFSGVRDRLRLSRSPFASWSAVWPCYCQMSFCAINPLIIWTFIAASINFTGLIFIKSTYAHTLRSPPYNFSRDTVVLVNVCAGCGGLLAFPLGGVLVGKIMDRLAKRNRGVREAEHFLVGYILPVLAGAVSTSIYGAAAQKQLHFAFYYVACGLNGFSAAALAISNILWVTEAFPRWAAPALSVLGGGCYVLCFSLNFGVMPWVEAHGFLLVGIELAVLQIFSGLVIVPIAFWGKSARQVIHGKWADERSGAIRPL